MTPQMRDHVARRTSYVMTGLTFALMGLVGVQYAEFRAFKGETYAECQERQRNDIAAAELRRVEVRTFRQIADFSLINRGFDEAVRVERKEAFDRLANTAQAALEEAVSTDCEARYR